MNLHFPALVPGATHACECCGWLTMYGQPCGVCHPVVRWALVSGSEHLGSFTDPVSAEAARLELDRSDSIVAFDLISAERIDTPEYLEWLRRTMATNYAANCAIWDSADDEGRCFRCNKRGHSSGNCPTFGPELREGWE